MSQRDSKSLLRLIKKSQLLNEAQLAEVGELVGSFPEGADFIKCLVRKKYLTRWQAGQLMKGLTSFIMGKYKLIDLLGAGGMGRVFRAEHIAMNRPVALKIISKDLVSDPVAQKRFLDEARAIAALNHPNIVHAYNIDKEGSRYYIVMEFVSGKDLEKVVREDGIPDQEKSVKYILQVASALDHAHERGMVHCDIKPANLLLNTDGQIKVLDMGLARLYGKNITDQVADDAPVDDSPLMGTIDYMAPEVANDASAVSPRSDLYSLGCVFYFLLTGAIPFPGETIPERILKHQSEDPTPPEKLNPRVDRQLSEICRKMMARQPEERYASAMEVVEALTDWLADEGASSSSLSFSLSSAASPAPSAPPEEAAKPAKPAKKRDSGEEMFLLPDFLAEPASSPKDSAGSTGIHLPGLPGFEEKSRFASVDTSKKRNSASVQEAVDSQTATKSFHDDSGLIAGLSVKKARRQSDSTAVLESPAAMPSALKDSVGDDLMYLPMSEDADSLKKNAYSAPDKKNVNKKGTGTTSGSRPKPVAKAIAPAAASPKVAAKKPVGTKKAGKPGFPVLYAAIGGGVLAVILLGALAYAFIGGSGKTEKGSKKVTDASETTAAEAVKAGDKQGDAGEAEPKPAKSGIRQINFSDALKTGDTTKPKTEAKTPDPVETAPEGEDAPAEGASAEEPSQEQTPAEAETTPAEPAPEAEKTEAPVEAEKPAQEKKVEAPPAEPEKPAEPEAAPAVPADAEPFKEMKGTRTLKLALAKDAPEVALATVLAGDAPIEIDLLGGETAIPQGTAKEPTVFKLAKKEDISDEKKAVWEIIYEQPASRKGAISQPVAEIQRDGNSLKLVWKPAEEVKDVANLKNAALRLACGDKTHVLGFREPVTFYAPIMDYKNKKHSVPIRFVDKDNKEKEKELQALPDPSVLFVEAQQVKDLDPGKTAFLEKLPKSACLADLKPKSPLCVPIIYNAIGNTDYAVAEFQLYLTAGKTGLGGNFMLAPAGPQPQTSMVQTLTPQIAAQTGASLPSLLKISALYGNSAHENIYKEAKKKLGEKDPKENEKMRAHGYVWLYETAEKLAEPCYFKFRVYMELDGEQFDLIQTLEPAPPEEPKKRGRR